MPREVNKMSAFFFFITNTKKKLCYSENVRDIDVSFPCPPVVAAHDLKRLARTLQTGSKL
jgi:hypothetical protein